MEKIVTHPLYIRCRKVIDSCETPEQLNTAIKYCKLAKKRTAIRLTPDLGNMGDYITHISAWNVLVPEVKWN